MTKRVAGATSEPKSQPDGWVSLITVIAPLSDFMNLTTVSKFQDIRLPEILHVLSAPDPAAVWNEPLAVPDGEQVVGVPGVTYTTTCPLYV